MSFETAESIISDAAHIGVNSLKFNWRGESTINPNFKKITEFAKERASGSVFVDRITNSNFKFKEYRDDIFEGLCNQTKVKVSLDSFDSQVFNRQRAKGNWDLTIENIDRFYQHPKRKDTQLVIQAIRTKLNKDEDIKHNAWCRWPEALVSVRDMVGGRVDQDLSALEHRTRDAKKRKSCLQAHVRLIFSWDGKCYPCCPDISGKLCIGDIKDDFISDIFNGIMVKHIRRGLKDKTIFNWNPCKTCSSHESYSGYKANWNS
jgi:radical SAM protein with 4Fe4S-binding SPASM domain